MIRRPGLIGLLAFAAVEAACGDGAGGPSGRADGGSEAGAPQGNDGPAAPGAEVGGGADRPIDAPADVAGGAGGRDGGAGGAPGDARDQATAPSDVAPPAPDAAADLPPAMACRAAGACDPFVTTGSGCPAGQLCVADGMTDRAACISPAADAGPPRGEGEACRSASDCAAGLLCAAGAAIPTCIRMCPKGSRGACREDERCSGTLAGQSCIQLCRPAPRACDPFLQNCPDTDACTLAIDPETSRGYTGCRPAGPRQEGEMCDGAAGTCARGMVCVRLTAGPTCVRLCRAGGTPACAGGKSCAGTLTTYGLMYCQ